MKNFEKFTIIALLLILLPFLGVNLYFTQTKYLLIILASIVIFALWKIVFPKISSLTKLLLTIGIVIVYTYVFETYTTLNPYPIIAYTDKPEIAQQLQNFIKQNTLADQEIHIQRDIYYATLRTNNHRLFDKLAIKIAQNPTFQYKVNIGMYFKHSNNPKVQKKRIEKALKNRIKLIKNVKSVKCNLEFTKENDKVNWQEAKIFVNVVINKKANKSNIYTIIDNFLPIPEDNKVIEITQK